MCTRIESERLLVAMRVLAGNTLRLLDEHLSADEYLLGIYHVVHGIEEHGKLVCASDQRQLELDFLMYEGKELIIGER